MDIWIYEHTVRRQGRRKSEQGNIKSKKGNQTRSVRVQSLPR